MIDVRYSFPESLWPVNRSSSQKYFERINRGLDIAKNSSVCVLGLARDCEKQIEVNLGRIQTLCQYFKNYHVKVYENDSLDLTPDLLRKWCYSHLGFECSTEKYNLEKNEQDYSLGRRERMAFYRNRYLEDLTFQEYDYTIIYDFDSTGGISYEGVFNSIGFEKYWSVIGSNSLMYDNHDNKARRLYYDSYALCLSEDEPQAEYTKEKQERYNLLQFHRGEEPFEVKSAFGGLAIYKSNSIGQCKYNSDYCDHVTLNAQLRKNGHKIYLNPSQIVLYNESYYHGNY